MQRIDFTNDAAAQRYLAPQEGMDAKENGVKHPGKLLANLEADRYATAH